MAIKKAEGRPTIDVMLVVVRTDEVEIAVDTASKIAVTPQIDTVDAIRLVKLGRLIAQKPPQETITGHEIVLTDNIFIPKLVQILQGGTITTDAEGNESYEPPVSGSTDKGKVFYLDAYSAVYDASGQIVKYEKITYPNCQGSPITVNTEDDVFRVSEYTITSAPRTGEPPYKITYVDNLPELVEDGEDIGGGEDVGEENPDEGTETQSMTPNSRAAIPGAKTSGYLGVQETGLSVGDSTELSEY